MFQRVNPLSPVMLQNLNRRTYPSECQKKESVPTFKTLSFLYPSVIDYTGRLFKSLIYK
jgi:hypothetical protein